MSVVYVSRYEDDSEERKRLFWMGKGKYGLISNLNDDEAWYSPHTSVFSFVKCEGQGDYTVWSWQQA